MPELLKRLKDEGVEIDIEKFSDNTKKVEEGEIKTKSIFGEEFIIRSDRLNQMLEGYEKGERDAWAHAIRVIRFLRKQGVDLEPQLETLDDFKDIIGSCLETYQRSVEDMIISSERGVRFARQEIQDKI